MYRYFPDRGALLDGLGNHMTEQMGGTPEEDISPPSSNSPGTSADVWADFDGMAELTKASILLNPDPANRTASQLRRTDRFVDIVRRSFPDLDADDQLRLGALFRVMASTHSWLHYREEFGMTGREAGELLSWAFSCVIREVRETGCVGLADSSDN